jgi:hypothetical protein
MAYRRKTINQILAMGNSLKKKNFVFECQKEILLWLDDIYYYLTTISLDGHNFIKIVFDDAFKYRLVRHNGMTNDNAKNHLLDLLNLLEYYYDQKILVD